MELAAGLTPSFLWQWRRLGRGEKAQSISHFGSGQKTCDCDGDLEIHFLFLGKGLTLPSSEATPWLFAAPFRWIASCHRKTDVFI